MGPTEAIRARALLSPLAYARGAGLPLARVWPAAARAFTGQAVTEYDLTKLLATDAAAPYVIEALDASGRSVYRLYHQALADDLRLQAEEAVLFERLYDAAPRARDGMRDWQHADPYLLEHLPAHAADADRVHVLLDDVDFLLQVEPTALMPVLDLARTPAGRLAAAIYRSCHEQLQGADPSTRRWALATSAARLGAAQFKERLRPASPDALDGLWPRWSTGSPQPALRNTIVGQISPAHAISCAILDERPVAVTASYDPGVRVWDLLSGQPVGAPLEGHTREVRGVACAVLDGRPIAVTTGVDRTLRVWDLDRGQQISQGPVANDGFVHTVACAMVGTRPVAITGGGHDDGLLAWDLARGPLIGERFVTSAGSVTAVDCGVLKGRPIVVGGGEDGTIRVWDLETRELLGPRIHKYSWAGRVETVACTTVNNRPVAVIVNAEQSLDSTVWVWDLARRKEMGRPLSVRSYVRSAACAVINGRPAAVTVGYNDGMIETWDLISHQRIGKPIRVRMGAPSRSRLPFSMVGR